MKKDFTSDLACELSNALYEKEILKIALKKACLELCKYRTPCKDCQMIKCYKNKSDCYFEIFKHQAKLDYEETWGKRPT